MILCWIYSSRSEIHGIMSLETENRKHLDVSPMFVNNNKEIKLLLFGDDLINDSNISVTNTNSCEYKIEAKVVVII